MITSFVVPSDPMQAGRLRKALAKVYRFSDGTTCTLGARILACRPVRKSHYIRHYARKKRQGEYKRLSAPAHEFTLWYSGLDSRESGIDVPKIVFDALPHLATETTGEPVYEERRGGSLVHLRPF